MSTSLSAGAVTSPDQLENLITLNRALVVQHLLRGIAHDLRNNLQVVALGSSLGEENQGTTIALRVERSLDSMVATLDLLSRIGKMSGTEPPGADLAEALSEIGEMAGLQRNYPTLRLSIERPSVNAMVAIIRADLVQILLNLIANAKEAGGSPSGQVVVTASPPADGRIAIHVDDRGEGMPADAGQAWLSSRDPGHHGGLGLVVCKALAERAGGQLSWAGRDGGGTRVTLVLRTIDPATL